MGTSHDPSSKTGKDVASAEVEKGGTGNSPSSQGLEHVRLDAHAVTERKGAQPSQLKGEDIQLSQESLPKAYRGTEVRDTSPAIQPPVVYGRRDSLPFGHRSIFHQILDIPNELKVFFGPVPAYSLADIRSRVCVMWNIDEPQLGHMVNQKLLDHLTAIYDKRRTNKHAFIEPLQRDYIRHCDETASLQALKAEIWPQKNGLAFTCFALDKAGTDTRHSGPPSEEETKSFFATLLAFAESLSYSDSGPATLLLKTYGRQLAGNYSERGLWWSHKVAHQAGLRSGHMRIKLHDE